jgi:hypothetical protein
VSDNLDVCGHPGPATNDGACVREKGHEPTDDHWFWHQPSKHGVWVFEADGTSVMHFDVDGWLSAEEVAILVAYMEWFRNDMMQEAEEEIKRRFQEDAN